MCDVPTGRRDASISTKVYGLIGASRKYRDARPKPLHDAMIVRDAQEQADGGKFVAGGLFSHHARNRTTASA